MRERTIQCRVDEQVLHVIFPMSTGSTMRKCQTQFLLDQQQPHVYTNPNRCRDILRASERYEGANRFVGFNFPASILTPEETTLFPYVSLFSVRYVIAYMGGDEDTMNHELRHAFFYVNPCYRSRVRRTWYLLQTHRPLVYEALIRKFTNDGYQPHTFIDEFQAYYPELIL